MKKFEIPEILKRIIKAKEDVDVQNTEFDETYKKLDGYVKDLLPLEEIKSMASWIKPVAYSLAATVIAAYVGTLVWGGFSQDWEPYRMVVWGIIEFFKMWKA